MNMMNDVNNCPNNRCLLISDVILRMEDARVHLEIGLIKFLRE